MKNKPFHFVFFKKYISLLILSIFLFNVLAPLSATAGFFSFGIKDEIELGRQFDVMVRSRLPLIEDPEIKNYVEDMLQKILKQAPPQPFEFKVAVLRDNAMNAFAAPGGYLFLHTGLIINMDSEDEVAAVLAHEVAHATQRHLAGRIEHSKKMTALTIVGALAAAVLGQGDGKGAGVAGSMALGQSSMLSYSRADEDEADQIGFKYYIDAGYKPDGMVNAFKKMQKKQWLNGRSIPAYLSTHPDLNERIKDIEARIRTLPKNIQNRKEDNTHFLRIQTIITAKYADPVVAIAKFNDILQTGTEKQKCLANLGMGIVLSRQNKVKEANESFNQALKCSPNDGLIIREFGIFNYYKGDSKQAEIYLSQALDKNPRDVLTNFYYGRLQADNGNLKEAEQLFKEVLRYLPQDPEVHEALAKVFGSKGEMFKAHLHLTYAYVYSNNNKKYKLQIVKLKELAKTSQEKDDVEKIESIMEERLKFI